MADRTLEWKILKCWEALKMIRKNQAFNSTKSRIVVRRQDFDAEEEITQREQYVAIYLNELQELSDVEHEITAAKTPHHDQENPNDAIKPALSEPELENTPNSTENNQSLTSTRRKRDKSNTALFDGASFDRDIAKQWIQKVCIKIPAFK